MTLNDSLEQGADKAGFEDAEFVQIRYTDVPGRFLAKYIATDSGDYLRSGVGVDGSSVKGFAKIDESDLLLVPDRSTLRLAPVPDYKVATVIADVYEGFGRGRLVRDPRHVSQLMEERLAQEGLLCQAGPEVECFIFDDIAFVKSGPQILSEERAGKYSIRRKGGYDAPPFQDSLMALRFEVAEILKKNYLIKVTNMNHEVASSGQIEINFMHSTLTKAADSVQIFKDTVRTVAKRHNKIANFMPKPIFDESDPGGSESDNGSGMHASMSLWSGTSNIFYDAGDDYAELSQAGRYFIGGVISHASSLAALVASTVNSYHRMVPGFEAPVYAAWSRGNRSAVLRVPVNDRHNAKSKRIEFRAPDPSANPYLAFSAIVAAGLDGIRKKIEPGNPVNEDIYKMTDYARTGLGIKSLPGSLQESIDALKADREYLNPCFQSDLLETFIALKKEEITYAAGSKERQFMLYHDV
ncbi:MAG: type I glutamate--ammonia ligase [Thaumarchaeota archaeon 13_1_40CM_3_50_5]|nr:MAG: type I glutamate--ammonia ligase [Thaumarchaeota archaeon 13_1_40CM_4_48_7]OLC81637.1 MAG: type I glutamate--ammonia ligase [Thaumarchaeota archaeon 13_1_40CM_3_50_5]